MREQSCVTTQPWSGRENVIFQTCVSVAKFKVLCVRLRWGLINKINVSFHVKLLVPGTSTMSPHKHDLYSTWTRSIRNAPGQIENGEISA